MTSELSDDALRTLGSSSAIADNFVVPYYLDDLKRRISVARVDDRFYAFDDLCTCSDEQCPLSGGLLRGTALMCQCHGSWFDITTGAVISGPATDALNRYDVQEVDGDLRVRIEAATVDAERSLLSFGGPRVATDLLKLLAWTGVVVALLLLLRSPTGRVARKR
jgi:3-phenylpropionate/trans-cinnamate dioxygenase ferredoxin subunit